MIQCNAATKIVTSWYSSCPPNYNQFLELRGVNLDAEGQCQVETILRFYDARAAEV